MIEAIKNTILAEAQERKTAVKDMAYKTGLSQTVPYRTYRLDRSTPVYRRGVPVVVIPRFKGLTLYTPTTTNAASNAFQTNVTGVAVAWPSIIK